MASEYENQPADDKLPSGRTAGIMIASASVLSVLFMAYHPTIHPHHTDDLFAEMNKVAFANRIVHGFLIALTGVLVCGFSCLASRLGFSSSVVRAGFVAYVMGSIAISAAALINGFMLPDLVLRYEGRPKEALEIMTHLLDWGGVVSHLCSKMGVLAMSIAIVLWSMTLVGRPGATRAAGLFGCVGGAALGIALLAGHLHMDVHGMLAFVLTQTIWSLMVAVQLIRGRIY
jgi:hypothetical protein